MSDKILKVLGALLVLALIIIYDVLVNGFVLVQAWKWFSPIAFPNLHYEMGMRPAIAIMLLVGQLKSTKSNGKKSINGEEIKEEINYTNFIIIPWLLLGILYVFHLFL